MSDHLLALGTFIFATDRLSYQEMERRADWNWAASPRFGARDALQYTGPGRDQITLNGVLVPELAGKYSDIETLRTMADTGEAHEVTLGSGKVLGLYVIQTVDDRAQNILKGGHARKHEFALDLLRFEP